MKRAVVLHVAVVIDDEDLGRLADQLHVTANGWGYIDPVVTVTDAKSGEEIEPDAYDEDT